MCISTNTKRVRDMNIAPLLRYTSDTYKDRDHNRFISSKQPLVSIKRTKNLKDYLVSSKYNHLVTPRIVNFHTDNNDP